MEDKQDKINQEIQDRTDNPQEVTIGMTKEEVLKEGWGRPDDINKTTTAGDVSEQWVFDNAYGIPTKFIYLDNGKVTSIQN